MNRAIVILGCFAGTFLAIPALALPSADRICLESGRIRDFDPQPDNRTILVTDSQFKKYRVTLQTPCLELKFRTTLGFQSLAGSQLACLGRGDRVIARGHGFAPDRCLIDSISAYVPARRKPH